MLTFKVLVDARSIASEDGARLKEAFPQVGFALAGSTEDMLRHAPGADVIFAKGATPDALAAAVKLRWFQAGTAGVDGILRHGLAQRGVLVTNARGAHGIPMAENVLAMALCFATRMHLMIRGQRERARPARRVLEEKWELHGQTLLVAGLGDVGGTLAMKAKGLGMRVLGVRRSAVGCADCDALYPPERLIEALPAADHVALCLPLTEQTRAIIGGRELRAMKPSAYLYNVGRGATIDGAALRLALAEQWIAGAGLDCVAPADTPSDDDPLWDMEDVILSLHTSGHSPHNSRRITGIFAENLRHFLAGQPLTNVVDPARGY